MKTFCSVRYRYPEEWKRDDLVFRLEYATTWNDSLVTFHVTDRMCKVCFEWPECMAVPNHFVSERSEGTFTLDINDIVSEAAADPSLSIEQSLSMLQNLEKHLAHEENLEPASEENLESEEKSFRCVWGDWMIDYSRGELLLKFPKLPVPLEQVIPQCFADDGTFRVDIGKLMQKMERQSQEVRRQYVEMLQKFVTNLAEPSPTVAE